MLKSSPFRKICSHTDNLFSLFSFLNNLRFRKIM